MEQYMYRYNYELCKEKGLTESDSLSGHYLDMQAVYRANLEAYLSEELGLKTLDEALKDSEWKFHVPKAEDKNPFERESTLDLEFIYLRNTLYIEYLEAEQLDLLESRARIGQAYVTDELKAMVKETYQEVIRVRIPGKWEDKKEFFYPEARGRKPKIPNEALVLGISSASGYDASGMLPPESHTREKYEYLAQIKAEKEEEYSELLGIKVYIIIE